MTVRVPRALLSLLVAVALVGVAPLAGGCRTSKKSTTTTETMEIPAGEPLPDGSVAEEDTTVRVTRETHVEEDKEAFCGGVFGCTAKVTWEIVKLPFRIVGFVLDILI